MTGEEMKDAYWFRHDSNASQDPKVLILLKLHGWAGYGRFWRIIESMREQVNYSLKIIDEYDWIALSAILNEEEEFTKAFIHDLIKIGLIVSDGESIWSDSLNERMKELDRRKESAVHSANARWQKEQDKRFQPPTIEAVKEYFKSKGSTDKEAEKFYHYYQSNDWRVGKNKMKNWHSAASGWILRSKEGYNGANNGSSKQDIKPKSTTKYDILTTGN